MSLKFQLFGKDVGTTLRRNMDLTYGRLADASRFAINDARTRILEAGRTDMSKGGNFGSARWQQGLQADVTPAQSRVVNLILAVYHRVPFARIFEYGGTIKGRPLLWIPLPWNPNKVRARDFPGKLFRVDRAGKNPLLMTSTGSGKASAMYVGVKQVRLKRRFHLRPIIRRVAKQMPFLFKRAMRLAKRRSR